MGRPSREKIGRMLRYFRTRAGLTVTDMARKIGLSRRMIYLYENFELCPSAPTRQRIYDTVLHELYGNTKERDIVFDELCKAAVEYSYGY